MSVGGLWACGTLGKVHGLGGDLYLNLAPRGLEHLSLGGRFCIASEDDQVPEGGGKLIPCEAVRIGGTDQRPLVRLDLAPTRGDAIALQGCELFASGGKLDALPYYRVGALLGLRVETAAGRLLGEVSDVIETPAHEVLEVRTPEGASVLVPLVEELVDVDEDARVARVVDGLLDDTLADEI